LSPKRRDKVMEQEEKRAYLENESAKPLLKIRRNK